MSGTAEHWNRIFSSRDDPELGWYENDAGQTLKFLQDILDIETATIFLPGAGTSVLVDALLPHCRHLLLNDISDAALGKLRKKIGDTEKVSWVHHDIARPLPAGLPAIDVWVDRAVLHFLLEEEQIEGYFSNLHVSVKEAGHVLLAEFSAEGAARCAGLDLHHYSAEEMAARLGSEFTLLRQEPYVFINPRGEPRPYTYALFQRDHNSRL